MIEKTTKEIVKQNLSIKYNDECKFHDDNLVWVLKSEYEKELERIKKEIEELLPILSKGINADRYSLNPDFNYISERYAFWKNQKNKDGLLYDFTTAKLKSHEDFLRLKLLNVFERDE